MANPTDSVACGLKAADNFRAGWYCSEAVFRALLHHLNQSDPHMARIAAGFASGVARQGGMCGALSGAIMAVGVATGRHDAQAPIAVTYDTVTQIMDAFKAKFGATNCCDLLDGCHLGTEEGRTRFREERLHRKCVSYTQTAAELCASLLPKQA